MMGTLERRFAASLVATMMSAHGLSPAQQPPPGFEVVQVAVNPDGARHPQINDCGQVVYSYYMHESQASDIILYDNGQFVNISNNGVSDWLADINDHGVITWTWNNDGTGRGRIVVRTTEYEHFVHRGHAPSINDRGQVGFSVYHVRNGCAYELDMYFFDGRHSSLIHSADRSNQSPDLNDSGNMVWTSYDFCQSPFVSQILLWKDKRLLVMQSNGQQPQAPSINNENVVAWSSPAGIEIWEKGNQRFLVEGNGLGGPVLNDLGSVYFFWWDEQLQRHQPWLYLRGVFHRLLTDTHWDHVVGDINQHDECVWSALAPTENYKWSIWLMRRIRTGEADFDGDIDLSDYAEAARCMDGPDFLERHRTDPTDTLCECRFLDLDHDNDVDLADFARFQNSFAPGA